MIEGWPPSHFTDSIEDKPFILFFEKNLSGSSPKIWPLENWFLSFYEIKVQKNIPIKNNYCS